MKRAIIGIMIVASVLAMAGCNTKAQTSSGTAAYDYYVDCTTKEQIVTLENESFVESIFPFSLLVFERPGTSRQIAYLATESFERVDTSSFDREAIIEEDTSILSNHECNPIIISSSLAKDEKLSIGDIMEQPCKLTEQSLQFTVGAIYKHESLFAQYDAVILLNENNNAVLLPVVNEAGYTNAYIKASDLGKLRHYFEEEFIPALLCLGYSADEVAELTREDIAPYYEDYQTHINRMK